jgi:hypothetical protein
MNCNINNSIDQFSIYIKQMLEISIILKKSKLYSTIIYLGSHLLLGEMKREKRASFM